MVLNDTHIFQFSGKTIEALAGAALRNYMQMLASSISSTNSSSGRRRQQRHGRRRNNKNTNQQQQQYQHQQHMLLPTLIVSPQDGIQNQWYETLIKSGVEPSRIKIIGEKKKVTTERKRKRKIAYSDDNDNDNNSHNDSKSTSSNDVGTTTAAAAMTMTKSSTSSSSSSREHQRQHRRQFQLQREDVGGGGGSYILCTRYNVQSEMKMLFDSCITKTNTLTIKNVNNNLNNSSNNRNRRNSNSKRKYQQQQQQQQQQQRMMKKNSSTPSVLFPRVPLHQIGKLRNQYMSEKGKEPNKFIREKETRQDCVARLVTSMDSTVAAAAVAATYHTIIVDEAHFCKNGKYI